MFVLRITSGPGAGESREIEDEVVVGREGADITIEDSELSRRHVALRRVDRGVEIEDLGSLNGTFVNGRRISGAVVLTASGTLKVGVSQAAVEVSLPQATRVAGAGAPAEQPAQAPEVTVQRPTAKPDVTVQRPTAEPAVTVQRPVQGSDVTVQRPASASNGTGEQSATSGPRTPTRSMLTRVLLGAGFAAAISGLVLTGLESTQADYVIRGLENGDEHAQYHIARETWMTLGILVVIALGAFSPPAHRNPVVWMTMLVAVGVYFLAMWSGPYTQGALAASAGPLFIQTASSFGLLAGVIMLRRDFRESA